MSNWNSACPGCMRHRSDCRCSKPPSRTPMQPVAPGDVTNEDFARVRLARKRFETMVERANETGDYREVDERISRFIEEA